MRPAEAWQRFWFAPAPLIRLGAFRVLAGWLMLYDAFLYDPRGVESIAASAVGSVAGGVEVTWRPIYAFEVLGIGPSALAHAELLHTVQVVAILCGLLGLRTRTAWLIAALAAFVSGGLVYSITKVRHDRVVLCFASFALAASPSGARFSLDALLARWRRAGAKDSGIAVEGDGATAWQARWPLRLAQVTLAIGYGAAGLAKVMTPGWTNGYTMQGILISHRSPEALTLAAERWAAVWLGWFAIAVECGLAAVLVWPRLAWFFVPAVIGFHLGTWATMDTGPYMTLWFFLVVFVPLDRVPHWTRGKPWRLALALALAAAWGGLVAAVMLRSMPLPLIGATLAATAALTYATLGPGRSAPGVGFALRDASS